MKLFLVRHASVIYTNDSKKNRHRGLSPLGMAQALEIATLWKHPVHHIYSSSLPRASQTVLPLSNKVQVPLIEDDMLVELDYRGDTMLFHEKTKEDRNFKFEGGESINEANARFASAIGAIVDRHADGTIVVGTHGTVLSEFLIRQFDFSKDFFFQLSYPDIYEIQCTDTGEFGSIRRAVEFLPETTVRHPRYQAPTSSHIV